MTETTTETAPPTTTAKVPAPPGGDRQPASGTEGPGEYGVLHELKCWPSHFAKLLSGAKTFELRMDDRGYVEGDRLRLREWEPATEEYLGRVLERRVTHVLRGPAPGSRSPIHGSLCPGWVILSLAPIAGPSTSASASEVALRLRASQDDCQRLRARVAELEAGQGRVQELEAWVGKLEAEHRTDMECRQRWADAIGLQDGESLGEAIHRILRELADLRQLRDRSPTADQDQTILVQQAEGELKFRRQLGAALHPGRLFSPTKRLDNPSRVQLLAEATAFRKHYDELIARADENRDALTEAGEAIRKLLALHYIQGELPELQALADRIPEPGPF